MNNDAIRVLCVFSTLNRGGAESMCMNLYRTIDREKVQFDFVKHTTEKCDFDEEIRSLGGRIFVAPRLKGYNLFSYRAWWRKHLNDHPEHSIIHGHFFSVLKFFFPLCKDRITIAHSHTDAYNNPLKLALIHGLEDMPDYRFACSEKAGKLLFPHKDFIVLKNAIDAERYRFQPMVREDVRKEFDFGNAFVLGAVGTIKTVKNPIGMIEILQSIHSVFPNVRLLWAGTDGGMKLEAEEKIRELKLTDTVIFAGVRSDVYRLLQGMDAFLMPSFTEGLPVSLIEAQAAGLPCFVSDTVTREADVTGLCTFLPLDDTTKWRNAILNDRPTREDMTQQIIDAGYDIHTTAEWLQDFYLSLDREYRERQTAK